MKEGGRSRDRNTQLPEKQRCHSNSIYRSTGTVELRGPPLADRNENFPPHLRLFLAFIIALLVLPFHVLNRSKYAWNERNFIGPSLAVQTVSHCENIVVLLQGKLQVPSFSINRNIHYGLMVVEGNYGPD